AVRDAVRRVLRAEGIEAVSHQRVAEAAGVGRASVYRHWPDRTHLVIDALTGAVPDPTGWRSTGDLVRDLAAEVGRLQGVLNDSPFVPDLVALVGRAEWDAGLRALKARLLAQGTGGLRRAIEHAAARGDLPTGTDVGEAVAALAGPLFYQRVLAHQRITDRFVAGVVERFVRAHARPSGG
ncbi:MAG: TetR/AcrR family transcriptional regulator, partial [Acidimicrobiia bacterium]